MEKDSSTCDMPQELTCGANITIHTTGLIVHTAQRSTSPYSSNGVVHLRAFYPFESTKEDHANIQGRGAWPKGF